jgi:hypothetical protein
MRCLTSNMLVRASCVFSSCSMFSHICRTVHRGAGRGELRCIVWCMGSNLIIRGVCYLLVDSDTCRHGTTHSAPSASGHVSHVPPGLRGARSGVVRRNELPDRTEVPLTVRCTTDARWHSLSIQNSALRSFICDRIYSILTYRVTRVPGAGPDRLRHLWRWRAAASCLYRTGTAERLRALAHSVYCPRSRFGVAGLPRGVC